MCLMNKQNIRPEWRTGYKVLYDPRKRQKLLKELPTTDGRRAAYEMRRRWFWQSIPSDQVVQFWAGGTIVANQGDGFHAFASKDAALALVKIENESADRRLRPRVVEVRILVHAIGNTPFSLDEPSGRRRTYHPLSYIGRELTLDQGERKKWLIKRKG